LALILGLEEEAGRLGLDISLQVYRTNPALGIYRRLGFMVLAESPSFLEMEWSARDILRR
jgi:ribosomal protein S18 acetylase RimI-like enzyme